MISTLVYNFCDNQVQVVIWCEYRTVTMCICSMLYVFLFYPCIVLLNKYNSILISATYQSFEKETNELNKTENNI